METSKAKKFRRNVGVRVLNLMAFVKHAICPSLAFEPGILGNERLIGREHNVRPLNPSKAKSFLDADAFSVYPVEAQC
jgi:hypothetical protein